jgi:hypothetical protein
MPILQQESEESTGNKASKQKRKQLFFFSQPCKPECLLKKNIRRFHFTCLTCWERRYTYKKYGWQKFTTYKKVMLILESASGKGFSFPKHYKVYGLIIPTDATGQNENALKGYLLKWWLTIAERIAEL